MLDPIRRIGCICLDANAVVSPLDAIEQAIAGEELTDALIVLPEALDLGDAYDRNKATQVFRISDLENVARRCKAAFVAGLSEKSLIPCRRPYNSAFLIDAGNTKPVCLSRKVNPDNKFALWYSAASDGDTQCINYRGLNLAALICKDAEDYNVTKEGLCAALQQRIASCLKNSGRNTAVLAVPARMKCQPNVVAEAWRPEIPEINVIIANVGNCGSGAASGVLLAGREWEPCRSGLCLSELALPDMPRSS